MLNYRCTVASLKIVLARVSGDIVLPQRLVYSRLGVPMILFLDFSFALFCKYFLYVLFNAQLNNKLHLWTPFLASNCNKPSPRTYIYKNSEPISTIDVL